MNQVAVHADFLRALIANSRDACVMLDPDLIITISNEEAAVLFGTHPDGLLSLRLDTLIPRGIPENGFPQSESGSFEGHCLDSAKRKIPIRICSYPVPEGNGTLVVLKRLQPGNKENPLALKEGQKQLRNYLNSAASMFVVLRPDYKISLVNQKVCDILGYPAEKLLDQNWLTFLGSPKDRKRLKLLFDRTLKGKSKLSDSFETYVLSQKGEKRLIRWQNALLKDADGMNTGLVCSGEDISAQKEAELELVQSEARNRAILEAIPDAILLHDQNGKILSVQESNPTGAIFHPEKLVGQTVTEAFPGGTGHQMLQKIRESCLKEESTILEITADGDQGRQYFEIRFACMENGQVLAVARDITRTNNTQQILDLRNRALEAAGNGILISDARLPDMPIIYSNEAFSRITGYAREEVLGKNCRFLQGADTDREKVRAIREALEKGVTSRVVLRNYRKDGRLFWNELTITPIEDAGGAVTHFIGVQNDVSRLVFEGERKDYTRKILEAITQDRPLKEISEGIADFLGNLEPETGLLISLWHTDKQCLESLASYRLPGPVEEKFKRIPLKKQKRCPCVKAVLTRDTVILEDLNRDTGAIPFRNALKDQGIRSYWSYPILSSERRVLGTCTFFGRKPGKPGKEQLELLKDAIQLTGLAIERYQTRRRIEESNRKLEQYAKNLEKDVAERTREVESTVQKLLETNISLQEQIQTTRQAEERATASQALFGAIARHFPKGVIMVFDKQLKYEHLEGEELERMGLKDWDFTGKSVMDTPELSPSTLMDLRTRINRTLKGKHLSFELQLDENTYSVNSTPLPVGEGMGLALFVLSNVTELKRAEEDLLRALRIEQELNDMKSRFISMASHEFRTPLSAIHSSAILIGKQNEPGYEEKRLRYLKQIQNNVRNLVVILDDFLSLGKLEEGRLECQPEHFDLLDLIRSVLEEMESNLKVGQHFHEDFEITSMQVHLDPKLMRHILVNLLSNAIKYSPENSAIFIHIRADADFLNVSVKDEGMGIPEEEHEQLFNRFFRAKNSVNIPGTGLGLHIVKHYTELMGGSIRFKSSLNEGSTFYLSLPVRFKPAGHEKDSDH
jgi:PAS domain S-box-containing protein